MKKLLAFLIPLCCTACTADTITVTYSEGHSPVVSPAEIDGLKITVKNGDVKIKDWRDDTTTPLTFVLKGTSSNGSFKLNTEAKTRIQLEGLNLTSQAGAPLHLKNKKKAELIAADDTQNTLTIAACTDTAKQKAAAIWTKDKLLLSGKGTLNIISQANGCKGINCKDDLTIEDLTLNVETLGDNLGVDTTRQAGPGGPPPNFNPDDLPEEVKAHFEEMRKHFEGMAQQGEHPMMGPPPMGGGPFGKQKYMNTCKGIKAKGILTINSGTVSVTTHSRGAEGLEGKQGININGGTVLVHAMDDAINSGGQIFFNGGHTQAISISNDAVDSNAGGDNPAIIITGGTVLAWSQNGPPEEGLDCDFSPIQVTGGTILSVGAGMGDMPSVPTTETALQPTVLLTGLDIQKDQPITLHETNKKGQPTGQPLFSYTVPFDFQSSSSLITCPTFRVGGSYIVKSGSNTYTFTLTQPFTVSRQGGARSR
ncbi:MAG: carbohydrate-binding domain-containing protein [Bacteroidaceae bacterium]|nr:carbohydrate-binding domain-containing protein [Bacteroidaceae bacterium]